MDKKHFDIEYSTQWKKEVEYLRSKGIFYTFVKTENGVPKYKYKKSSKLFDALATFYCESNTDRI